MRRSTIWPAALTALAWTALTATQAAAASIIPAPVGTSLVIYNGTQEAVDAMVSGDLVAYVTSSDGSSARVRYHNISTGLDNLVPNGTPGSGDYLPDVDGSRIVFTRNSSTGAHIMLYDVSNPAPGPIALAPHPMETLKSATIGGGTVAWEDWTTPSGYSIVVAYDLASGVATALTTDSGLPNVAPAVAPDGSVIVWLKCATDLTRCNVWRAVRSGSSWTTAPLTTDSLVGSHDGFPVVDTNGSLVVYSKGSATSDIYAQPVAGGPEQNLTGGLGGLSHNPAISGNIISFELSVPVAGDPYGSTNVWNYDLANGAAYQLSSSGRAGPSPTDVSVTRDGTVNVVWTNFGLLSTVEGYQYHLDAPLAMTHFAAGTAGLDAAAGATFTDADPQGQLSQYSASIDWGDGVRSSGRAVANPLGGFAAGGVHRYAAAGAYTIMITIFDSAGAQTSASKTVYAVGR